MIRGEFKQFLTNVRPLQLTWSWLNSSARGGRIVRESRTRAKSMRSLTFAAVDIQLLRRWLALRACGPVGVPHMFWCEAECD